MKPTTYNVVLVCRNSEGAPISVPYRVSCTPEEYDEVEFMDDLCLDAEAKGYVIDSEFPIVVADGDPLWEAFTYVYDEADWDNATLIDLV